MVFVLIFLFGAVPFFAAAQQAPFVVINEIAWPVEPAYAADHGLKMGTVVINEVAWMGTPVKGVDTKQEWRYEWLELYNTGEDSLSLDGWSVQLHKGDEIYFTIPLRGTILAQGYFLIGASDKIDGVDPVKQQQLPYGVDINYANLSGKFVNDGMRIAIKDSIGDVVDEVDGSSGWQAGENASKRTMERMQGRDPCMMQGSLPCMEWQTSGAPGGTPRSKNSKGLQELVKSSSSFAIKKDPSGSSQDSFRLFNSTTLLAFLLALGSSLLILGLSRLLARQS
ncbi:MAG: lamin tail domain-containing protein [bacterium]|nr:lamin tail domain-containing protein [bacterium]